MCKTIWTIIKKECSRFLKDRRMIFTIIILPALILYGTYTAVGAFIDESLTVEEGYAYRCYVQNAPASYDGIFESLNFELTEVQDLEAAKEAVVNKNADLLVIFPENFDQQLVTPAELVPDIQVYYTSDAMESYEAYEIFIAATNNFETSLANVLDVNRDVENPDLAPFSTQTLAMLPSLIVMVLFSCCISFAPESIAGEKERGTMATLLVTPISRTAIAVGKIISLSIFAILAGLSNFVGIFLGMGNLIPEGAGSLIPDYGMKEYTMVLLVIVSTVLMTIALISVISAVAKSVKEATSAASMVTALATVGTMACQMAFNFSGIGWRCVPILNTAMSLNDIMVQKYSVADIAVTCGANVVFTVLMGVVLSKMFNSEKVMFTK